MLQQSEWPNVRKTVASGVRRTPLAAAVAAEAAAEAPAADAAAAALQHSCM